MSGAKPEIAMVYRISNQFDVLLGQLIGLAKVTDGNEHLICPSCTELIAEVLDFIHSAGADADLAPYSQRIEEEKWSLVPDCRLCASPCGRHRAIADALVETAKNLGITGQILDVGCGEGYYSARLADALDAPLTGLDISKEAVRCAAAKYKNARWSVLWNALKSRQNIKSLSLNRM